MRAIRLIVVHHSAGAEHVTVDQIRKEHVAKGYGDVGYHFLIHRCEKAGPWVLSPCRPLGTTGAHDAGQNTGSIGVCIAGDYTRGPVDRWAWDLLTGFLAGLAERFGLEPDQVQGHGENEPPRTPTACPGFDPELLRMAVHEQLQRAATWSQEA